MDKPFAPHASREGHPDYEQHTRRESALYARRDDIRSPYARDYTRMRQIIRYTGTVVLLFGAACAAVFITQAPHLVRFFIDERTSVRYGTQFLHIIGYAAPLAAISYLCVTVFQACGRKWPAFALSVLRKGVFDVPAMFVFRTILGFGAAGVCLATPFAEVLGMAVALVLYLRFWVRLRRA